MTSDGGLGASRRTARERAFQLLYQADLLEKSASDLVDSAEAPIDEYTKLVVDVADSRLEEIDDLIAARLRPDWPWERVPSVERALLRLGAAELLGVQDVPAAVILSEAVELAQRYTTVDGAKFVNGLLAELARSVRPQEFLGSV